MKKVLTIILSLCLLVALATCVVFSSNGEEIKVTVNQKFSYNSQKGTPESEGAWWKTHGSEDGLWKYQYFALGRQIYKDMVFSSSTSSYAWHATPGDTGIGYARVSEYGAKFHPAIEADVAKVFTCPSGGTVDISTTISRIADLVNDGEATGTSFAIYVGDEMVYPESGTPLTLVSTEEKEIEITDIPVAKNQPIYFQIGALGNQAGDAVHMENTVTYRSVTDEEVDPVSDVSITFHRPSNTLDVGGKTTDGSGRVPGSKDGGLSTGAIIGIVVGGVAVVGIAAAAVVIVKKKKEQ